MKIFKYLPFLLLSALIASCGGGGNNSLTGGGTGTGPGGTTASSLQVLTSAPNLSSDQSGGNFVTISAIVRDENNNVMPDQTVVFSANTGSIEVQNAITTAAGIAEAFLKGGIDVSNRTITVTVSVPASGISRQITVNIVGTSLQVDGPASIASGDSAIFNLLLTDGQGVGIEGQTISLTSANGNDLSNASPVTTATGDVQVTLTANGTNTVADVINAQVLGLSVDTNLLVSNDIFAFLSPAASTEVGLDPDFETLTLQWQQDGVNVPDGSTVELTADRGTLSSGSITTAGGIAAVDISSVFAGFSRITATGTTLGATPIADGPTTQLRIEFVAETPDNVNVAAFPDNLVFGEQATVTAVVKDAAGNRVKGLNVDFNLLSDPSGGSLSVSSDVTDSQGVATTTFTAGNATTEKDGVEITAIVRIDPAIKDSALLTVTGRAINFVIGSGNSLIEVTPTRFGMPWSVTVTDVTGVPVPGEELRLTLKSTDYTKGFLEVNAAGERWVYAFRADPPDGPIPLSCPDEDFSANGGNENGSLDPGEDNQPPGESGFGSLDAGNIATIVAADCEEVEDAPPGASQQTLVTDAAGAVELCVVYPQDHNLWVDVRLTATVQVDGGTESTESRFFTLPALADDLTAIDADPPGQVSPFGFEPTCTNLD